MFNNDDFHIEVLPDEVEGAQAKARAEAEAAQWVGALAGEEVRLKELLKKEARIKELAEEEAKEKARLMGAERLVSSIGETVTFYDYHIPGLKACCKMLFDQRLSDFQYGVPLMRVQMSISSPLLSTRLLNVATAMNLGVTFVPGYGWGERDKIDFQPFWVQLELFDTGRKEAALASMNVLPAVIQNLVVDFVGEGTSVSQGHEEMQSTCNALMATCKLFFDPRLGHLEHADPDEFKKVEFAGTEEAVELLTTDLLNSVKILYNR